MEAQKILKFCLEKGILLDSEVLGLFSEVNDLESVKLVIEKIKNHTHQRIITKNIFGENKDQVNQLFLTLPKKNQKKFEKLKIKLGLSIEISREQEFKSSKIDQDNLLIKSIKVNQEEINDVKILSIDPPLSRKLVVVDFVKHFRNRFSEMRNILQNHAELENLVSINKISGNRQGISIIGMISDKKITKNKNLLFEVEDLTGRIRVLINQNKPEVYKKAKEVCLDSVIGFKCSGNERIVFANEIIFPESILSE